MAVRPKSGYIPTLDGWRAIAVGLVLLAHSPLPVTVPLFVMIRSYGGTAGVDLFFAISGLLICSRLLEEERLTGRISLRGFYIRRSFRIFPAAYLYLLFVAVIGLLHWTPVDWSAWCSALVFLRNYYETFVGATIGGGITGHFWTLAIEEHFYLLLPSVLVFFPSRRKLALFLLVFSAFLWLGLYVHIVPQAQRSYEWQKRTDLGIGSLLFPAWIAFFLAKESSRRLWTRFVHPAGVATMLVTLFVCLLLKKHYFPEVATAPLVPVGGYVVPVRGGPINLFKDVAVPLIFPLLVVSTMLHPRTLLGRLLEWSPLRAIGRISYSLYLWQELFWLIKTEGWPIASYPRLWLVAIIPLPFLSYFLLEKPMIRLGHRLATPVTPGHRDLEAEAP